MNPAWRADAAIDANTASTKHRFMIVSSEDVFVTLGPTENLIRTTSGRVRPHMLESHLIYRHDELVMHNHRNPIVNSNSSITPPVFFNPN